jgi:hypothetical protein
MVKMNIVACSTVAHLKAERQERLGHPSKADSSCLTGKCEALSSNPNTTNLEIDYR